MAAVGPNIQTMSVGGIDLEVDIRGDGPPLLLLSSEEQLENNSSIVEKLASRFKVVLPSAPGFGHSERPVWLTRAEDIAFVYHDLIKQLELTDMTVLGFSMGGWIAAEMAVINDSVIRKLVMVDAFGVKIGGPTDVDIQDLWIQHPDKITALTWAKPDNAVRDYSAMSEAELTVVARNRESFARLCWEPYMHNPKLKHRLHRISAPTLVIWGEKDGITSPDYGRAYAQLIAGSQFETISGAGHFPHLENESDFLSAFDTFA